MNPSPATLLLVAFATILASGCVGLNLPSVRYHEAHDPGAIPTIDEALLFSRQPTGCQMPAGPQTGSDEALQRQIEDEARERAKHEASLPKVPWPRFHPVPTAPVFEPKAAMPPGDLLLP